MGRLRHHDGPNRREDFATWVYALGEEGVPGFIKIGMCDDIQNRIADLQCGNPRPLYLVFAIRTRRRSHARRIEEEALQRCAGCRSIGEWVKLSEPLAESILCHAANDLNIEVLGYAPGKGKP